MNSEIFKINDKISYLKGTDNPLSADIGIIKDNGVIWLFDTGNGEIPLSFLKGEYNSVISHFHIDHSGNVNNLNIKDLYVTNETYKHVGKGIVVKSDLFIGNLHIFCLPTSHCKGSLGLEVDEEYAFVGDAIYSKVKDGYYIYNAQLLKEEIEVLKKLKARYLLLSHVKGLVKDKDTVIKELEEIYDLRTKESYEIKVKINER